MQLRHIILEQDLKTLEFIPHDEYTKKFFNFIGEESLTIRQINEILRFNAARIKFFFHPNEVSGQLIQEENHLIWYTKEKRCFSGVPGSRGLFYALLDSHIPDQGKAISARSHLDVFYKIEEVLASRKAHREKIISRIKEEEQRESTRQASILNNRNSKPQTTESLRKMADSLL